MIELTIILLVVGIGLLILEMFIPGFGVSGVLGLLCLVGAVLTQIGNPEGMFFMAALAVFLVAVAIFIFSRLAVNGKFDKSRIILNESIDAPSTHSGDESVKELKGAIGVTTTALRPAGKARFKDQILDVVSDGEFLSVGAQVEIVELEGMRVMVRPYTGEKYEYAKQAESEDAAL